MTDVPSIFTIGHSNHSFERFHELIAKHGITAVADVRSSPFSRHNPQFNRESLSKALRHEGIAYVFVGKELGARSDDPTCYEGGQVSYARLANTELFKAGLARVLNGAKKYRIALMCAEKEPLDCHRTLLVCRALEAFDVSIAHILANGSLEPQEQSMSRLLDLVGLPQKDMFRSRQELVEKACEIRERKVAYIEISLGED